MKAKIYTMMKKINTKMTQDNMKEWMQKNIVNESEEYSGIHKNINENEPYDINENKFDENTVAYKSDIKVSTEGSDLKLFSRASRLVERLGPTLKGQSYNNTSDHKIQNMNGNIEL